jgi:hypothetical protein
MYYKEDRKKVYKKELPDAEIPNEASAKED